jgi:alkanesulfonate monooxygenase SsuD/methylene tetrahydromethanopterin reductase-like flavin-dependent oxidoreductase (luciferase family)
MSRQLTFGLQSLGLGWNDLRADWLAFDEAGWDSLWLPDHLSTPNPAAEPSDFLEAWMALAAMAQLTSHARLGVLVSSNTFRHPSVLAKQAVTVDHISGGRLDLGIGAGWFEREHEEFGLELPPIGERVSRYAEALALLDTFLRNDLTTFEGKYYQLHEAPNRPTPVQSPRMPIMVGAHGPRTMKIAARHADIWNSRGTVEEMAERNQAIDAAAIAAGRDPGSIIRSVSYFPARTEERPWASVEAFTSWVERYQAVGFTDFIFEAPAPEQRDVAERIARDVLPQFRAG